MGFKYQITTREKYFLTITVVDWIDVFTRKELAEVDNRESAIIVQFNTDTAQLNKQLADLRASREIEVGRAAKWNAEDARIENAYKEKLSDYNTSQG